MVLVVAIFNPCLDETYFYGKRLKCFQKNVEFRKVLIEGANI